MIELLMVSKFLLVMLVLASICLFFAGAALLSSGGVGFGLLVIVGGNNTDGFFCGNGGEIKQIGTRYRTILLSSKPYIPSGRHTLG